VSEGINPNWGVAMEVIGSKTHRLTSKQYMNPWSLYEDTNISKGWFEFKMQCIELTDPNVHSVFNQRTFACASAHKKHPKKFILCIRQ
jgi:hypothetical protein